MEREEYEAWAARRAHYETRSHQSLVRHRRFGNWPKYLADLAIERGYYRRQSRLSVLGHAPVYRQPGLVVVAYDPDRGELAKFYDLEEAGDCGFNPNEIVRAIEVRNGARGDIALGRGPAVLPRGRGRPRKQGMNYVGPGVEQGWRYRGVYWFYENPMGGLI